MGPKALFWLMQLQCHLCHHLEPPLFLVNKDNSLCLLRCPICAWQVERLLDSVDAVLYLLDYSKLKTAEEANLLGKLKV